jgi:predicted unusual protein kinase regulating ubiquinone biosynthesis (AarF/ABC1/UbiB family)
LNSFAKIIIIARVLPAQVPPFGDEEAMAALRQELGVADLSTVFKTLSASPVASASIGQVYRGELLDGRAVAVKVQRPSVLGDICLDLYLLRLLTPLQTYASNWANGLATDPADVATGLALVDEWGRGFVQEVDYRLEAKNTQEFKAAMERRQLNAVTAPTVVAELSTATVLVTEWVAGSRLDRDASADVPRLCGVAVNAYLTMLLDTGTLHCDPHPGNLLRTPDGKLCVLDWGMTLQVPPDLQYALLEFIAHVNAEDFDALPLDFVNLGFTPPEKLAQVQNSGLTEGLAFALRQLGPGGGANKVPL